MMAKPREGGLVRRTLDRRTRHGLDDLLDEVVQVREVELDRIGPNPRQPRRVIDAGGIEELAASIERHGLLQPIVIREGAAGYELVAGSRRLRAVESLGRPRITALVVKDGDPETLALVENLQRADLDPIDEAQALAALKARHAFTLEELQGLVGRSISYLSEIMSLLRLPEAILNEARARAAEGRPLPRASLVELARIKEPALQATAWRRMLAGEDGSRAGVRALRKEGGQEGGAPSSLPGPGALTRRLEDLASILERAGDEPIWRRAEVREALLTLRGRINRLLSEGT